MSNRCISLIKQRFWSSDAYELTTQTV